MRICKQSPTNCIKKRRKRPSTNNKQIFRKGQKEPSACMPFERGFDSSWTQGRILRRRSIDPRDPIGTNGADRKLVDVSKKFDSKIETKNFRWTIGGIATRSRSPSRPHWDPGYYYLHAIHCCDGWRSLAISKNFRQNRRYVVFSFLSFP